MYVALIFRSVISLLVYKLMLVLCQSHALMCVAYLTGFHYIQTDLGAKGSRVIVVFLYVGVENVK